MIRLCLVVLLATVTLTSASACRCQNGGDCVYDALGFKYCKCPKNWSGRYCTEPVECSTPDCHINNLNNCASSPCSSVGAKACHDRIGSYYCECKKGYVGLLCQFKDGCATNPCHASATCYANPTNGTAMCACPKGYKSDDCSVDINECEEMGSPCEHGGVCVNTEGSFRCNCAVGFEGARCEININECASNPCLNEGTCLDEIGGYRCICMPGYTGSQCETDIDECANSPCLNNGVCTNLINGYRCLCPNGFNGTRCEINENECANSPCLNGGHCIDGIAQYTCQCPPGWTGHNCENNINECLNHSCLNGGHCIDGINGYSCVCQPGFIGPSCETNVNDCASNPCYHGGQCVDLINGFKCECPLGTSGVRCEYNTNECWSNPCRNGAICHDKINGYDCECKPGYTGLNCEIDIDECASNPCANGGKCHDLPNGFKCTCPRGYYDSRCLSDVNECDPNPCLNGGKCQDEVNGFTCHCLSGFGGTRCELEVDACASSPCQHNGQCINYMGNYKCVCNPEFTGKSCEINISDCNASIFGDCLLGYNVNPWINCTHSTFCWKAFSDGVCNDVCNNKECLFDGMDCLYKQKISGSNNQYVVDKDIGKQDIRLNGKRRQCDPEFDSYCQRNYQNGYCDQGCNNEQCGWDGLDCLEINQKNGIKQQINYADLPYVARGSLTITLDLPISKVSVNDLNNQLSQKGASSSKQDERPIFAILRTLSQIVGTTLRVKQNYNDGTFILKPIKGENGENMTEIEVIADNRLCEYDCFDSATQIANYLAAFQARTNELSHEFGHSEKFSLKSIRASEEAESLVASKDPKNSNGPNSVTTWVLSCVIIVFVGLMLGVLVSNREKSNFIKSITWFPEGFTLKSEGSCRSISTSQAAGANYLRKPLGKIRGLSKFDRKPDGQEMSKAWLPHEPILENKEFNSAAIYEEPKDTRAWTVQHYEAYGENKNGQSNNGVVLPFPIPSNLKEILHPGLRQTQNMMQTKADTEQHMNNGLLSPPLVNGLNGGVDVTGPSGLTPLMIAAAYRGPPYCGVGDESTTNESNKLLDNNVDPMDTHNGPGSAGSSNGNNVTTVIDHLINEGANVDKKMENTGETSLHLAARFCRADAVKRLLEAKADCNAKDFSGRTPLHTAIAADALGAFEILINNRATSLNAKSNDGNTPLILAVRNCSDSMMAELLTAGADINAVDNCQRTALHWAAMVSNIKALKALIEHGANKDAQDEKEQTPLFLAAREGAGECVRTLLQCGANKDIADHMDVSPRKIAESKCHKDIIQILDATVPITVTNVPQKTTNNASDQPSSPKKSLNSSNNGSEFNTNTAKRPRKQAKNSTNQTVNQPNTNAKTLVTNQQQQPVQQQQQIPRPLNVQDLLQQNANYSSTPNLNQINSNTLKKGQSMNMNVNPNSALNQQPPPLPPPRPLVQQQQTQAIQQQQQVVQQQNATTNTAKIAKSQIVNLPPINYNQPPQFDYMMHTPLTPTCTTTNNLLINQQTQIQMPNTPNSLPPINSPPCTNHALLSPNNTVLMSPPHQMPHNQPQIPSHYLGKPPPYESINHCHSMPPQQQMNCTTNATYMTANYQQTTNQWTKIEPNYYSLFNNATNHNNPNDISYLTPSPDSPGNWSATSPASSNGGDWLELQTPQQQQTQVNNQEIVNNNNQIVLQQQLIDQQQLSPEQQFNNQNQMTQEHLINNEQQLNQPPTYQSSCQNQQPINAQAANARQITSTQQAVFL